MVQGDSQPTSIVKPSSSGQLAFAKSQNGVWQGISRSCSWGFLIIGTFSPRLLVSLPWSAHSKLIAENALEHMPDQFHGLTVRGEATMTANININIRLCCLWVGVYQQEVVVSGLVHESDHMVH